MVCANLCVKVIDRSTYPWLRHERPGRAGELCVLSHRSGCIFPQYKQVTSNTSHTLASPLFDSPYRGDRFARFPFVTLRGLADYIYALVERFLAGSFAAMPPNFQVPCWPDDSTDGIAAVGPYGPRTTLPRETVLRDCS